MKQNKIKIHCLNCQREVTVDKNQESQECPNCQNEICTQCGGLIKFEYENNGFQEPDPTHYEVKGGQCINCGHKIIY